MEQWMDGRWDWGGSHGALSLAPRVSTNEDGAVTGEEFRASRGIADLTNLDIDVLVKAVHLIKQLK